VSAIQIYQLLFFPFLLEKLLPALLDCGLLGEDLWKLNAVPVISGDSQRRNGVGHSGQLVHETVF